jgi:hypothetical protein
MYGFEGLHSVSGTLKMVDELLAKICQDSRAEIARQVPSAKY